MKYHSLEAALFALENLYRNNAFMSPRGTRTIWTQAADMLHSQVKAFEKHGAEHSGKPDPKCDFCVTANK